jgi:hypothetical protein
MCHTNYIKSFFVSEPIRLEQLKDVQVSMKRSDGEIFTSRITLLTVEEATKVRKLFSHFEELRTCNCTRGSVCDIHSGLEKNHGKEKEN